MSEYQYYEFRAIDKPLTQQQMGALRKLSTRAEITPTSFTNEYHWGDFHGNPQQMMERYFDAFLYYANWGTHWFMLRLPRKLCDLKAMKQYCTDDCFKIRTKGESVVLEFRSEDESGDWEDEGDESRLASLIPLRAELLSGDMRGLYLGWLASVQACELDDDDIEPPVPPGLKQLSASLRELADFLRIDDKLIKVAAATNTEQSPSPPGRIELSRWIKAMPSSEKDKTILQIVEGNAPNLRERLLQQFQQSSVKKGHLKAAKAKVATRRTVGELLAAAGLK